VFFCGLANRVRVDGGRPGAAAEPVGCLRITRTSALFCIRGLSCTTPRSAVTRSAAAAKTCGYGDAFQFVWKKMEGDFTLTADIPCSGKAEIRTRRRC